MTEPRTEAVEGLVGLDAENERAGVPKWARGRFPFCRPAAVDASLLRSLSTPSDSYSKRNAASLPSDDATG